MVIALPLLHLLQLSSSALPVGAYSYSEGVESLVYDGRLSNGDALGDWVRGELRWGSIRVEGAIAHRIHQAVTQQDIDRIAYWNQWLSASRDSEELREQNWQMGRALARLLLSLEEWHGTPDLRNFLSQNQPPVNFATAFAIAAAHRHIPSDSMLLGYLHSWASNLIAAGIKLIPLGQTEGQQLLSALYPDIEHAAQIAMTLLDDELSSCTWGLAIASMTHETLYSRLFRS